MRILFMGTPDFAVASLKRLVEDGHDVCGVFTQPDKPKNRGMKMTFSPVKGPEGNIEFLGHLTLDQVQGIVPDTALVVEQAHAALDKGEK